MDVAPLHGQREERESFYRSTTAVATHTRRAPQARSGSAQREELAPRWLCDARLGSGGVERSHSASKMHTATGQSMLLVLLLLLGVPAVAMKEHLKIEDDYRLMITIDTFGFDEGGVIKLSMDGLAVSMPAITGLSQHSASAGGRKALTGRRGRCRCMTRTGIN